MSDLHPLRCSGCGRRFGWSNTDKNLRQVYCERWCAEEPSVTRSDSDERRNQLWEALEQAGYSHPAIADMWGIGRTRVSTEVLRRREERGQ